jgi:glycosyltransferase involved in cell wall biosynthesis
LKIAFFCPNKPLTHTHPSGDLTIARDLQQALRSMGHECREIIQFRTRWFWQSGKRCLQASGALFGAYESTLQFSPDLWLTYHSYYKSPDILGPTITRLQNIPYVLFQPIYSTKPRKVAETRLGFYLNRLALKASTFTFTNNHNDLEALGRILPAARISYLPSGIVPDAFLRSETSRRRIRGRFRIPEEAPVIMTAARFRPGVKTESLAYLLRSLARIGTEPPGVTLLMVGDGPMEKDLRALAEDLLPGQVIFTGRVDRSDMVQFYSAADLFAFPGIGESLGMVYLEAQACGLPVVALDSPGVSQVVVSGQTGVLVPRDDGQALAVAILDLLRDPEKRRELGHRGVQFVRDQRDVRQNYRQLSKGLEGIARDFAATRHHRS